MIFGRRQPNLVPAEQRSRPERLDQAAVQWWWAHLTLLRTNITPTFLCKKIEELPLLGAMSGD
jgi:hypothetical protein